MRGDKLAVSPVLPYHIMPAIVAKLVSRVDTERKARMISELFEKAFEIPLALRVFKRYLDI